MAEGAKEDVLSILRGKGDEAQSAVNLALGVSLRASVTSLADPGKTPPKFKDALTVVSPTQKFQVIAKLHNGSKYWLIVGNARMDEPRGWVKQTDASEMTIAPGQNYYANFALQVPADAPPTRPYWHRDDPETEALNIIDVAKYQTLPLPPPPLRVGLRYETVEKNGGHSPVPDVLQRRGPGKAVPAGEISATVLVPFVDDEGKTDKTGLSVAPVFW